MPRPIEWKQAPELCAAKRNGQLAVGMSQGLGPLVHSVHLSSMSTCPIFPPVHLSVLSVHLYIFFHLSYELGQIGQVNRMDQ